MSRETAERLARHRLIAGDILVPRRGELSRYLRVNGATAGTLCGTGCLVIRFDDQRVNSDYFATFYGSAHAQAYLADVATGTIMPNINPKILGSMPVLLPTKIDQDRFVSACDAIDRAISALVNTAGSTSGVFDAAMLTLMDTAA